LKKADECVHQNKGIFKCCAIVGNRANQDMIRSNGPGVEAD